MKLLTAVVSMVVAVFAVSAVAAAKAPAVAAEKAAPATVPIPRLSMDLAMKAARAGIDAIRFDLE